jgi:hypothetical protein
MWPSAHAQLSTAVENNISSLHERFEHYISVLATGPEVRGFKLCSGGVFLRAIKICSSPSFEEEVKPEAPLRKTLQHVKYHLQVWK